MAPAHTDATSFAYRRRTTAKATQRKVTNHVATRGEHGIACGQADERTTMQWPALHVVAMGALGGARVGWSGRGVTGASKGGRMSGQHRISRDWLVGQESVGQPARGRPI